LIIDFMALALSSANVYGYYKCSSDQKAQFQQMMQQGAQAGAMSVLRAQAGAMTGSMMGWIAGTNNSQQQPSQGQSQPSTYV
jgi:hypothetical protein